MSERTRPNHTREELEEIYEQVWDTDEVMNDFDIIRFLSPYCFGVRKSDGVTGRLSFQHNPRYYFNFKEG